MDHGGVIVDGDVGIQLAVDVLAIDHPIEPVAW